MACASKTDYKRRLRESPPEIFHTQHLQKTQNFFERWLCRRLKKSDCLITASYVSPVLMAKPNLEYYTAMSDSPEGLDDNVNQKLAEGWALQGGLCLTTVRAAAETPGPKQSEPWVVWAQAMVREKEADGI